MTPAELRTELAGMGVTHPDPLQTLRACLYLNELQATYDLFHTTLARAVNAGGFGPDYARVSQALRDPELLNSLSKALDKIIIEAVNADLAARANQAQPPPADFTAYYEQFVLNNYPADRTAFLNLYPVTRTLVQAIGNNFRNNIRVACQRVIDDWDTLQTTFVNDPAGRLQRLAGIGSSGSDFHKGGQQVLILSFNVRYLITNFVVGAPANRIINIIYKPGDVEADCLIAGDSAAVNAIHHNFMANSLFEILNTRIATAKQQDPLLELEDLPVYKILPMVYGSQYAANVNPVPVRTAYGYLQYLEHFFDPGLRIPFFGYYPFGSGNFTIFRSQDREAICSRFYRVIGQLTAIASTFSIIDLHLENVIVRDYMPFLIDMEVCLNTLVNDVTNTSLYGYLSGVTGLLGAETYRFSEDGNAGNLAISAHPSQSEEKNRLWTAEPSSAINPGDYAAGICRSLRDMVTVIQGGFNANVLDPWRNRVLNNNQGIVVRYLPLATLDFQGLLHSWYNEMNCNDPGILARFIDVQRGIMYLPWAALPHPNAADPKFLTFQDAYVTADFRNADIPIFYHRAGSRDIVDSRGITVNIPTNISYRQNPAANPIQANINLGRNTYFAQGPFLDRVFNTQLQAISGNPGRDNRINALVGQVLGQLGLANAANDIQNILQ